jgi:hypothetical protein
MNIGLLKRGFLVTESWKLHKMIIVFIVSFLGGIGRLVGPNFLSPRLTGADYHNFL